MCSIRKGVNMKRLFSMFLLMTITMSIIVMSGNKAEAEAINTSTFYQRVSEYQKAYPEGSKCLNETFTYNKITVGRTCHGYARKMTGYVFGTECGNGYSDGWIRYSATSSASNISSLSIGDIVRYRSSAGSSYDHTIFVTDITDDIIRFTDCNSDNYGTVKWDREITKANLETKLLLPLHDNNGYGWFAHYAYSPMIPLKQVILFEHENFKGTYRILEIGTYNCPSQMNFPNDSLTSLKIGAGVKVLLGQHDNFGGIATEFASSVSTLVGSPFPNDECSSIKVCLK
jgi:hypothetical protein